MKKIFILVAVLLSFKAFLFASEHKLRVISLAPSITEILFALGLDEEIVGVSSFCNYPPQANNKPRIGSFSQPDIEKIISLRPDIVFCTGLQQERVVNQLKQLNLKLYISDPKNIEELMVSIKEIGQITNRVKEADELVNNMRRNINLVINKTKDIPLNKRPKVFFLFWDEPLMTVGYGCFIDELIYLAGGRNITHHIKRPYTYFSFEQLIKEDPECIIATYMGKDKYSFRKNFIWNFLKATKSNRIYTDIEPDILLRPGPRLIEGLLKIYQRLYFEDEKF
ncbi:MAG: cobalamin-binding protein [Candidatus Omnitrophica bacterium]|nr:cobalamin-binding protein [Candidatus Omnitrophota bacterium]